MYIHHTKNKGDLGVLKVKADLCEKGFLILSPETEHSPFDLVAYDGTRFLRVQVKYRTVNKGKVSVRSSTCWADSHGSHKREYDMTQIDYFAIYVEDLGKCFYFPSSLFGSSVDLSFRVETPKNNQKEYRSLFDYSGAP